MVFTETDRLRYITPFLGLFEGWRWKLMLGFVLETLGVLFTSNSVLWAMVALLIVIDFASGVGRALVKRDFVPSILMRQTFVKTIEYLLFIGAFIVISNGYTETVGNRVPTWFVLEYLDGVFRELDRIAFFIVAVTEVKSIVENTLSRRTRETMRQAANIFLRFRNVTPRSAPPDLSTVVREMEKQESTENRSSSEE